MTVRELSNLYYLRKLIRRDTLRLAELEAGTLPGIAHMDGMPHGGQPHGLDDTAARLSEMRDRIRRKIAEYRAEQTRLESYIDSVQDARIRLILTLRFVDLLSWQQVAQRLGGDTVDSVKKACYRYIDTSG